MMDHESHGKIQFPYVFEHHIYESQSLVVVEEELEFPLENGYTLFGELHDYTTLEPTYEESFSFLREVHNPTPMDPSHYEKFALSDHLRELVHPTLHYFASFILMKYG